MNDDERDQLIAQLIARPYERKRILHDAKLNDQERESITALIDTADLLWLSAQSAPPLADDPVAAMLGLVPSRECSLDSGALRRARKRVGLAVSDLAERLRERGWEFHKGDVFRWETQSAADVAPAVVQAIADILGRPVESLIVAPSSTSAQDELANVRQHPLFEQLADRWARIQHVSRDVAAAALETRMVASVHRGERPDPAQLLHAIEALVASVEQAHEE
jgi:transcriptional regulator with XRE-family HTH domain